MELQRLTLPGGVALHYVERGRGEPLVFVHGGGKDVRYWRRPIEPFARRFHVVAYSRRYAFPNDNAPIVPDYSARTDADDLGALLAALALGPAHLVAASVGAAAALLVAVGQPHLVRSLVLAEPPVLGWARAALEGDALLREFDRTTWAPAAGAFRDGRPDDAMALIIDAFVGAGSFHRLPAPARARVMQNARDWEAHVTSRTPFPDLPREALQAIRVPVLMLTGERTTRLHALVDDELAAALPAVTHVTRVTIPGASHDMWADAPEACGEATLAFLAGLAGAPAVTSPPGS